jgi:hypothetical protein
MESLKIVLLCIGAAGLYGIIHDQFTARICLEYFTVFHPPVFQTQSPTLLALGWGVIATWWVGAILGILLTIASRAGPRPKLSASVLVGPIGTLLVVMAASAIFCGSLGFLLCRHGYIFPSAWVVPRLAPSVHARFMADWWAHTASYAVGFFGGIALCIVQYRRRSA